MTLLAIEKEGSGGVNGSINGHINHPSFPRFVHLSAPGRPSILMELRGEIERDGKPVYYFKNHYPGLGRPIEGLSGPETEVTAEEMKALQRGHLVPDFYKELPSNMFG